MNCCDVTLAYCSRCQQLVWRAQLGQLSGQVASSAHTFTEMALRMLASLAPRSMFSDSSRLSTVVLVPAALQWEIQRV